MGKGSGAVASLSTSPGRQGGTGAGTYGTNGPAWGARPRACGTYRSAGGAQPAMSMERCAKRAYAVVSGPRRKWSSPRRGRCWGRRSLSLRPFSDSLLGRPGESCSTEPSCPGNRDHAPGFALRPNPEKAENNDPSIALGPRTVSTENRRIPGTRGQSASSRLATGGLPAPQAQGEDTPKQPAFGQRPAGVGQGRPPPV